MTQVIGPRRPTELRGMLVGPYRFWELREACHTLGMIGSNR